MAITSFPFDNQDTTEDQYGLLFRELQDSGVADSQGGNGFRVTGDGSGMSVKVQPGFALVRGHAIMSTAVETVTIGSAGTQARVDAVILRLDPNANSIVLTVRPGAAGSTTLPPLTQTDSGIYEVPLAAIAVAAGATNIAANAVSEARQFVGSRVRAWTTTTRPSAPRTGQLGFNVARGAWEFWSGAAWTDLAPTINFSNIDGKPATFPTTWDQVSGKPTQFNPSTHQHAATQVLASNGMTLENWVNSLNANKANLSHSHAASTISTTGGNVQSDINFLAQIKSDFNHTHDFYNQTSVRADGSNRPHNVAIGGGGNWYSVWVDGAGWFCRNTSSIRYKKNVRDVDFRAEDVLALTPRIYDRKDDVAPDGTPRTGRKNEFGLIAEEVAETMPELVQYEDGQIDSVRYDLVGVALLKVVQEQSERIARLEALLAER